jgi:hypothetical protein
VRARAARGPRSSSWDREVGRGLKGRVDLSIGWTITTASASSGSAAPVKGARKAIKKEAVKTVELDPKTSPIGVVWDGDAGTHKDYQDVDSLLAFLDVSNVLNSASYTRPDAKLIAQLIQRDIGSRKMSAYFCMKGQNATRPLLLLDKDSVAEACEMLKRWTPRSTAWLHFKNEAVKAVSTVRSLAWKTTWRWRPQVNDGDVAALQGLLDGNGEQEDSDGDADPAVRPAHLLSAAAELPGPDHAAE